MAEKYNLNPTESEVDAKIFRVIAAHSKALSKPTPEMQAVRTANPVDQIQH